MINDFIASYNISSSTILASPSLIMHWVYTRLASSISHLIFVNWHQNAIIHMAPLQFTVNSSSSMLNSPFQCTIDIELKMLDLPSFMLEFVLLVTQPALEHSVLMWRQRISQFRSYVRFHMCSQLFASCNYSLKHE